MFQILVAKDDQLDGGERVSALLCDEGGDQTGGRSTQERHRTSADRTESSSANQSSVFGWFLLIKLLLKNKCQISLFEIVFKFNFAVHFVKVRVAL